MNQSLSIEQYEFYKKLEADLTSRIICSEKLENNILKDIEVLFYHEIDRTVTAIVRFKINDREFKEAFKSKEQMILEEDRMKIYDKIGDMVTGAIKQFFLGNIKVRQ